MGDKISLATYPRKLLFWEQNRMRSEYTWEKKKKKAHRLLMDMCGTGQRDELES